MTSRSEYKLDAQARAYLAGLEEHPQGRMNVIVRGTREFTDDVLGSLKEEGVHIRTVVGDILTADLAPDRLSDVLDIDDIAQVTVSGPMYEDSATGSSTGLSEAD